MWLDDRFRRLSGRSAAPNSEPVVFSYYSYFLFFFSKKKNKKTKTNSPLILFVFFSPEKKQHNVSFSSCAVDFSFPIFRPSCSRNKRETELNGKKKRRNRQAVKGSREIRLARRYAAKWRWRNNKKKQPKHEIRKIINAKRNDNKTRNDFPPSAMGPRRAVSAAVGADEMILPSFFVLFFFFFLTAISRSLALAQSIGRFHWKCWNFSISYRLSALLHRCFSETIVWSIWSASICEFILF